MGQSVRVEPGTSPYVDRIRKSSGMKRHAMAPKLNVPPPTQAASLAAWRDESHVIANRTYYREKFAAVLEILGNRPGMQAPQAGFYLWSRTPVDDTEFARELYRQQNLTVLPGRYLSRDTETGNPGHRYIRMALVPPLDECVDAARRIERFLETFS